MISKTNEVARQLAGGHYYCEDCYYSCPLAEDSCSSKTECDCGLEKKVVAIASAITSAVAEERERAAKIAEEKFGVVELMKMGSRSIMTIEQAKQQLEIARAIRQTPTQEGV